MFIRTCSRVSRELQENTLVEMRVIYFHDALCFLSTIYWPGNDEVTPYTILVQRYPFSMKGRTNIESTLVFLKMNTCVQDQNQNIEAM